ncbi:short chain dehydrogenase family protein [Mycobacterium kansasii]|uniref:Short chain dehydrogenase family protein n=1 Tax=Mycobacterium kansasii TaxID=1768 RepID=A0A1V3WI83_MYCKA|nr:short chain dehydrogenase family protein [Mycobacterium kansasii]
MFSSAAALLGSPGQGAYAAANSWLDAFVQWRRVRGLPATAIAWGPWAEVGRGAHLAENADTTMIAPTRAHTRSRRCFDTPAPIAVMSRSSDHHG